MGAGPASVRFGPHDWLALTVVTLDTAGVRH
jgi:hypothetical protein